jgi:mitochondrial import inner membrane translocase subunit TIM23
MSFPVDPRDDTVQADPDRLNVPRRRPPVDGVVYNPAFLALYDLPTSPEVLYDDALGEAHKWADDLIGYTGTSYLAGAAVGAFAGLRRAIVEAKRGEPAKVRVNRVLNNCGSVGRAYGNRAGVIAMLFVATKAAVRRCRSGADDWVNTAAAGIGTGALFRMPGGLRSAAVGGVVGGLFAGAAMLAAKAPVFRRSTLGVHGNNTRHYSS